MYTHALRINYIYTGTGHTWSGSEAVSVSTMLPQAAFSDTVESMLKSELHPTGGNATHTWEVVPV